MADSQRIEELKRRVESDPTSIAFAQLAEEYRRAGHLEEAVRVARSGLVRHPGYLSARVTLGRALMSLDRDDEAQTEFELVLKSAPENLVAVRSLAEIHQRKGDLPEAIYEHHETTYEHQAALNTGKEDLEADFSVTSSPTEPIPEPRVASESTSHAPPDTFLDAADHMPDASGPSESISSDADPALGWSSATAVPESLVVSAPGNSVIEPSVPFGPPAPIPESPATPTPPVTVPEVTAPPTFDLTDSFSTGSNEPPSEFDLRLNTEEFGRALEALDALASAPLSAVPDTPLAHEPPNPIFGPSVTSAPVSPIPEPPMPLSPDLGPDTPLTVDLAGSFSTAPSSAAAEIDLPDSALTLEPLNAISESSVTSAPVISEPPLMSSPTDSGTEAPLTLDLAASFSTASSPPPAEIDLQISTEDFGRALEALDALTLDVPDLQVQLEDNTVATGEWTLQEVSSDLTVREESPAVAALGAGDITALRELERWLGAIIHDRQSRQQLEQH